MGLFDDLDETLAIPGDEPMAVPADVDPILIRLREGWVHTIERRQPGQERRRDVQYQQVELGFDGERFTWVNRLLEGKGRQRVTSHSEDRRTYDDQGLRDALGENPWVAQAAFQALGIDLSKPDF